MLSEAEKYKAEDEAAASRIQAKNGLESYSYNLKNSVEGDLKDKLDASDKATLEKEINETISWLEASQEASKEEYADRQKSLEAVANPIMVCFPPSPVLFLILPDPLYRLHFSSDESLWRRWCTRRNARDASRIPRCWSRWPRRTRSRRTFSRGG